MQEARVVVTGQRWWRCTRPPAPEDEKVALHEAAQARYLNYALSVIT